MVGYSSIGASFYPALVMSFFRGGVSDSEELLTSCTPATLALGTETEAFAPMLVFDVLVEVGACETERFTGVPLTLAGGGMSDCAGSSNERLPLGFVADCIL